MVEKVALSSNQPSRGNGEREQFDTRVHTTTILPGIAYFHYARVEYAVPLSGRVRNLAGPLRIQ